MAAELRVTAASAHESTTMMFPALQPSIERIGSFVRQHTPWLALRPREASCAAIRGAPRAPSEGTRPYTRHRLAS